MLRVPYISNNFINIIDYKKLIYLQSMELSPYYRMKDLRYSKVNQGVNTKPVYQKIKGYPKQREGKYV